MRYILTILLLASTAQAQTVPTDLVIVRHKFATVAAQQSILKAGLRRQSELGVTQPISKVTITKDVCPNTNHIKHYTGKGFDCWLKAAYRNGWCSKGKRCHVSKGPIYDDKGIDYSGGVAIGSCTVLDSQDFSFSIARTTNGKGVPKTGLSITTVAHENAHNNGAEHDEDGKPYIMHPDAGKYGNQVLQFSRFSKELVDICMMEKGLRQTSKYGFGNPNYKGKINKVEEELIR